MTAPDPKTCAHCQRDLAGASTYTIQGIDVCADIRNCLARQAERKQQPAEATGGEQAQDGAAASLRTWLASRAGDDQLGHDVRAVLDNREAWRNLARSRGAERDAARTEVARAWEDLTTVREERDALAARVAELEGEREADTRAVAEVADAAGALPIPRYESMPELAEALNALYARFEERITKAGG